MKTVTLVNIHIYLTLEGTYRGYVRKEHPAYGLVPDAWGYDKNDVISKLARNLAEANIPFDFSR